MFIKCWTVSTLLLLHLCIDGVLSDFKETTQSQQDPFLLQRYGRESPDQKVVRNQDGTVKRVERLQCYVCSWSTMGPGNNASEKYDICSSGHFQRDQISVIPCEHGCQSVSFRNSAKEEIRHFYRNCLKAEGEGKDLRDKCYKIKTVYGLEERCECLSNLCNSSPSIKSYGIRFIFILSIPTSLYFIRI